MKHIVVLGAGMVGSAIAADLCREYRVTAVDASRERVEALAVGDAARLVLPGALHQLADLRRWLGDVEHATFLLGDEALVLEEAEHRARALLADARSERDVRDRDPDDRAC